MTTPRGERAGIKGCSVKKIGDNVTMQLRGLLLLHLVCLASSMEGSRTRSTPKGQITTVRVSNEGGTARRTSLECVTNDRFTPAPVLNANWTMDGRALIPSERIRILADSVIIDPILPQDEGLYRCNNGNDFELTTPPHVIDSEQIYVMHELGPEVRLGCGIRLGNVSRSKAYEVDWQRVLGEDSFIIISTCTGPHYDGEDTVQNDCKPEFDFEDFSITRRNVQPDDNGRAVFKCIVKLQLQPSSSPPSSPEDTKSRDVDTVIMFYEPAAIHPSLPPYTVVHSGEGLTLHIGFSGHPLEYIKWENNGEPLSESLVNKVSNTSSLFLGPQNIEQGDRIRATVNVLNKSFDSSETVIVILYPVESVSVERPPGGDCVPPVLTLSLPAPIPIPQSPDYPQPIQLHIEYTRINSDTTSEETGVVYKSYNASDLTGSRKLRMPLSNLPYSLLSWEAYVVRVRIQVLGEFSRNWSTYSQPFCVDCSECRNAPSVKINLRLSFPENSKLCSNRVLEGLEEALVNELLVAIQRSCPEYLCRDLELTEVELKCLGETAGLLKASASGVGTEGNVQSFLKSITEKNPPLILSLNGTTVQVSSVQEQPTPPGSGTDRLLEITGYIVGFILTSLLVLLSLVITYSVWRRRKLQSSCQTYSCTSEHHEAPATTGEETETTPPHQHSRTGAPGCHGDAGLPNTERHKPQNSNLSLPSSPNGSVRYQTRMIQINSPLQTTVASSHRFTPSPLTMSQAGHLAQMEDNLDNDSSSVDTSVYAPHSEISFALTGSTSATLRPFTPLSSKISVYGELPSSQSVGHRSRQNLSLPLTKTSTTAPHETPCTCSCHSRESTPLPSPSPSTSLLGCTPFQQRGSAMRRSKTVSPLISPYYSTHYTLWTNHRAASPRPRLHLPRRQGASESPV